ncbi:hypothetical protein caldi_14690 [Caldinitratiruptor microaerophilus]|uniref:Uncharacterized protein n=1 Tax=Caldinitratiruptor microaerophilus TaxID=671077 RepID=A0AA35G9K3_9FIRM|nr:hypothetical protein caldi_14690 [Caldinitratiruptor microaerophilus]
MPIRARSCLTATSACPASRSRTASRCSPSSAGSSDATSDLYRPTVPRRPWPIRRTGWSGRTDPGPTTHVAAILGGKGSRLARSRRRRGSRPPSPPRRRPARGSPGCRRTLSCPGRRSPGPAPWRREAGPPGHEIVEVMCVLTRVRSVGIYISDQQRALEFYTRRSAAT